MNVDLQIKNGVTLRLAGALDLDACGAIVKEHWSDIERVCLQEQFVEFIQGGRYSPVFFVATEASKVIGFCAMRRSMLKSGLWEFIWCAVTKECQGRGIGDMMVEYRLEIARTNDGFSVLLVTQEPQYFNRFGFMTDRDHGDGWVTMTAQLKLFPSTGKKKRKK